MSRPLRSAISFSHALAGPSRLGPAVPRPAQLSQSRSAYNFANLGFSRLWGRSTEPATTTPATSDAAASSVTTAEAETSGSLFDEMGKEAESKRVGKHHEHRYKSAFHKISHRKLNMISRQISGLPIDEAIVQMEFSEKRASGWIKSTLALARDHASDKGLRRARLVVAETWVSKGPKIARVDIKGRGRAGIKHHPSARFHVVLREGKTWEEQQAAERRKELGKVRSAGVVREDGKLRRKVVSGWTW